MLETLRKIVQQVNEAQSLADALEIIVERVRNAMGTEVCSVYMHDPGSERYLLCANEGLNSEQVGVASLAVGEGLVGLVAAGVILVGALKMKKLSGYNWAMTASIIAVVPCVSPCCLLGLPIGIWALVVLAKPEVKSQFT